NSTEPCRLVNGYFRERLKTNSIESTRYFVNQVAHYTASNHPVNRYFAIRFEALQPSKPPLQACRPTHQGGEL
ncbi:hypothetical protein, partial [Marinobacter sp. X15-166B]|uniref:hypothetical protein n=1 Tax=Marinobacter sp. X15-166B TaxID=1897620 RepID=UPI001A7E09C8